MFLESKNVRALLWSLIFVFAISNCAQAFDLANSILPRGPKKNGRRANSRNDVDQVTSLLTIGGHAFPNYAYPTISYQRSIFRRLSLGILGLYSNTKEDAGESLLHGGMLTLNIFLGTKDFEGFCLQGGYGFWNFDTRLKGETERFFRTTYSGTFGYRGFFENIIRVGFAVGVLHAEPIHSKQLNVNLGGTVPLLTIDIGFGF